MRTRTTFRVSHPFASEYRAVIVAGAGVIPTDLEVTSVRDAVTEGLGVYIDETTLPVWKSRLVELGLRREASSSVRALDLLRVLPRSQQKFGDTLLEHVLPSNVDEWTSQYVRLFRRDADSASVDFKRWRLAARSAAIENYLVRRQGAVIGTFQLCWHAGVVGLYSVASGGAMSIVELRAAFDALAASAQQRGVGLVYFERLGASPAGVSSDPSGSRVIRRYDVWG